MVLTGLDAGFRKGLFVLNSSKQKHEKFLNFHQNSLENEIILPKGGLRPVNVTPLYVYFNVGSFGFCYKFLAALNQVSLINLIKILCVCFFFFFFFFLLCDIYIQLIKYFLCKTT